jgi:hypothetical protein
MAEDVTYRVTQTKAYDTPDSAKAFAVHREVGTPGGTSSSRIAKYRKRSTAQAVAAILETLADQEV